jgi:hypothetical protein
MKNIQNRNRFILAFFAPVLIIAGLCGPIFDGGLMSTADAYNIFHIVFGTAGLCFLFSGRSFLMRAFNIGFGLIDLYQVVASFFGWFPTEYFKWKTADDVLHLVIGGVLLTVGLLSDKG